MLQRFDEIIDKLITESSISKIMSYVYNFECATISASRNMITNTTEKTFIPDNYKPETQLTKEDNRKRNSELKALLLKYGYGVTALDGKFAEAGQEFPGKETSYFVVNRFNDPNFFQNIFQLAEYFNQDSFLYKPADSKSAKLVGTNAVERSESEYQPGYNQELNIGEFHPTGFDGALSKMRNKAFQFRLNENTQHDKLFIANKILSEETFENLSNYSKAGVTDTYNQFQRKIKLNSGKNIVNNLQHLSMQYEPNLDKHPVINEKIKVKKTILKPVRITKLGYTGKQKSVDIPLGYPGLIPNCGSNSSGESTGAGGIDAGGCDACGDIG